MNSIASLIAQELSVQNKQVTAAIQLLDEGSTVPFIARYRKEVTGALDDGQLRQLEERLRYLRELAERRQTIINSIDEQGKLDDALLNDLNAAQTKAELEDLYLPYKPKRRTKGEIAKEAGLEPLATALFDDPRLNPEEEAQAYLNPEHQIDSTKAALEGARFILMERFSEDAKLLARLKKYLWESGEVQSEVISGMENQAEKFKDYFDYQEAVNKIPSHRALALFRGRNESMLAVRLDLPADQRPSGEPHPCETQIALHLGFENQDRPSDKWLQEVFRWTWKVKLHHHIESELLSQLRESAEGQAIDVFAENLKDLLLAAPAGNKTTMGLDPGLRTGVKVAIVDATGKLLDFSTIYPHAPQKQWQESLATLKHLVEKHDVELISIGNGTASRETEKLASELCQDCSGRSLSRIIVNEAGASVYSASELAAQEFPDIDVTIRGAVSIARRLQDPLSELVKIEPKAIGVGQYQHDVSQIQLGRSLNAVVEDCVNAVGVDLNMASAPLLAQVSGLSNSVANQIVSYRDKQGAFKNREELKLVPRLGDKAFEQCAGFLKITEGSNPLDASSVHPESYPLVAKIAANAQQSVEALIGNSKLIQGLSANDFVNDQYGELTVKDVLAELAKPGRDPRPEFRFAAYKEGVETLSDLKEGMVLEGSVTNVTHFGAFVDIGVHQDGLVHISALANRFVKDPRDVVKTGDIVKVKVMEVDTKRKRIALTMRLEEQPAPKTSKPSPNKAANKVGKRENKASQPTNNALGSALSAAFEKAR